MTREYDVVVIGSGSGTYLAGRALYEGYRVALIDRGPLGGTCPNTGCIPSKMLIHAADRLMEIAHAERIGIATSGTGVDIPFLFDRMRRERARRNSITRSWIQSKENLDFYETETHFIGDYTLLAGEERIKGERIFIVTGARPSVPPLNGLRERDVLTNENLLELRSLPGSLIIIGGGYIAAEYGHFFSAMGTQVTILQRNTRILPLEEPEISARLAGILARRMRVETGIEAREALHSTEGVTIRGVDRDTGIRREFSAEKILLATGRVSNADTLRPDRTGVETDERGYIITDAYLETTKPGIWAAGDANGRAMFRHVANQEVRVAWHNATHREKIRMDYTAVPHAVYTYPPIAAVGLGEEEARRSHDILTGTARYSDIAKGVAMTETDGCVKVILERGSGKLLGCHILGPSAPAIIHEAVQIIARGGTIADLLGMHIHPSLGELIPKAVDGLRREFPDLPPVPPYSRG